MNVIEIFHKFFSAIQEMSKKATKNQHNKRNHHNGTKNAENFSLAVLILTVFCITIETKIKLSPNISVFLLAKLQTRKFMLKSFKWRSAAVDVTQLVALEAIELESFSRRIYKKTNLHKFHDQKVIAAVQGLMVLRPTSGFTANPT